METLKPKLIPKRKSFTLIEVVVSLTIIIMVTAALVVLALVSIKSYSSVDLRLKAINLAREGIEQVRQVRDSARLGSTGGCFNLPTSGCFSVDSSCHPPGLKTESCGAGGADVMVKAFTINASGITEGGMKTASTLGTDEFGRLMMISDVGGAEGVAANKIYSVTVAVYWKENNNELKNTTFSTYLGKW